MVKRFLSVILLLAFAVVNFSKVIILVHYELYKTQITQEYCINKDKPQMHCCGKCHLKKQLAKEDAQQNAPNFPDVKNDMQLFSSHYTVVFQVDLDIFSVVNSPYKGVYLAGTHISVFHPPCC